MRPIGDGYLILTASTASGMGTHFEKFAVGDKVTLTTTCNDASLENAKWATGGGDILVSDGAITDTATWDKAIAAKNPRTAFGIKADGTIVSYVVDGRRPSYSVGLTLKELAEEFLAMGCIAAINFDGGGSSALSMRIPGSSSSKTINSPSDSSERSCANLCAFCNR